MSARRRFRGSAPDAKERFVSNGPPPLEDILRLPERPEDLEYRLGLLGGMQGTWH
jgi:hypothetical protein